jgi:hypothetical protein
MQTLGELQPNFALYAVCSPCKRMQALPLSQLIETLGSHTPISEVRQRLRCQQCHERTEDIRIVFTGPCNQAAGFHYRRQ